MKLVNLKPTYSIWKITPALALSALILLMRFPPGGARRALSRRPARRRRVSPQHQYGRSLLCKGI